MTHKCKHPPFVYIIWVSDEYVLIFSLVHVIHLLKNGILVEDVIITLLTNLILCIICSTHEGMVSHGIYLFKIEQTYILDLYKRVAVCWKCNCQWTWKYVFLFIWYSNSKWIPFYWKYFYNKTLFSFVYLLEGHNCAWFWGYSVHHAGICKTVPLGIINKISLSLNRIYIIGL